MINDIITLLNTNKICVYSIYTLVDINTKINTIFEILNNLENILKKINNDRKYYTLLELIILNLESIYNISNYNIKHRINDMLISSNILKYISQSQKCFKLLKHVNNNIYNKISDSTINEYIVFLLEKSNIKSLNFWLTKKNKKHNIYNSLFHNNIYPENILHDICQSVTINNNSKVFKFIIKELNRNDKVFFNNIIINSIINILITKNINESILLKRINLLSLYIDLTPWLNQLIINLKSNNVILKVHKAYYKNPYTITVLYQLYETMYKNNYKIKKYMNEIIILYLTDTEIILSYLIIYFKYNIFINKIKFIEKKQIINIIEENIDDICKLIFKYNIDKIIFNDYIINILLLYILSNNLIIKYILTENIHKKYYLFINFNDIIHINLYKLSLEKIKYITSANKILYNLKLYIRKNIKYKIYKYYIKMFKVHYELKYYKPNKNIAVLKNGSIIYQHNKFKFNKNISNIVLNDMIKYEHFILKTYDNIIFIRYLPITSLPNNLFNYQIKTEYNEKLDLYLIHDIDIPNTTYYERYTYLRKLHPYTKSFDIKTINCIKEYNYILNDENNIINNFNLKYINSIKWYPKVCVIINNFKFIDYIKKTNNNYLLTILDTDIIEERIIYKNV